MTDARRRQAPQYAVTLDRAGHAVAAGGLATAVIATGLFFAGGVRGAGSLLSAALVSAFIGILAIVAVGGPIWVALHASGRRGPGAAAGAGFGGTLLLASFGTALMPPDASSATERIVAIASTTLGLAGIGAGIALLMWRIAYRRVDSSRA